MPDQNSLVKQKNGKVGYCNPPEITRFKKGRSGNPSGRPKGTLNMSTVLERTLREKMVIEEKGKRRTVTKLEAAIRQVAEKAIAGDLKALQLLAALVRSAEDRAAQAPTSGPAFDESDEKVVFSILKRLEFTGKGDKEHESEAQ